jgi:peptide/nickel transport system substrate-binding protein
MRFKPTTRTRALVALSSVGLLALAACGGSGNTTDSQGTFDQNSGAAGASRDPDRQPPAPDIPGAKSGGTVRVISNDGLNSMDPTEAYYINTGSILTNLVTRSLTQYVYDEKSGDMILVPDLATDLGDHNADYTKWTFEIRDGVKFENGQEVTADDIAFGIKRSFDRSTFPEGPSYSNDYFLDGDSYKGPYSDKGDYKGVTVDGNTLTIKMAKPFPDMPYWGTFPAMGPIPEGDASDPAKYALHPWATGPYMFKEYVPEKSLTLVKNPNWDPDTDPGRHQYVDGWDMQFDVPSAKVDQIMLNDEGDGQTTLTYDNIQSANFVTAKNDASDRLVLGSSPCSFYWGPDYRTVTDMDVRKALAYAYPYQEAWAAGGEIVGVTRVPGTNLMPPGIPGRTEYNPLPDHEPGTTDADKAKQLLQDSGNMDYPVKFLYSQDDPVSVDTKDAIVKGLKAAGFDPQPYATTVADNSTLRADPNTDINVRSSGWCSDWPTGSSWFPPVIQSTDIAEEGLGANYSVFKEADVDKKIQEIQRMPIDEQNKAWNDLDKYVAETYFPLFSTGYAGVDMMHGSKIHNMFNDNTYGAPTFRDIWIG